MAFDEQGNWVPGQSMLDLRAQRGYRSAIRDGLAEQAIEKAGWNKGTSYAGQLTGSAKPELGEDTGFQVIASTPASSAFVDPANIFAPQSTYNVNPLLQDAAPEADWIVERHTVAQ